jgi:hypothetical protein
VSQGFIILPILSSHGHALHFDRFVCVCVVLLILNLSVRFILQ